MDAGDRDAGAGGVVTDLLARVGGDVGHVVGDRERSNLDGIVDDAARERHGVGQFPILEDLVANPEAHKHER